MDGHFVGNYTLGTDFVKALKTKNKYSSRYSFNGRKT